MLLVAVHHILNGALKVVEYILRVNAFSNLKTVEYLGVRRTATEGAAKAVAPVGEAVPPVCYVGQHHRFVVYDVGLSDL